MPATLTRRGTPGSSWVAKPRSVATHGGEQALVLDGLRGVRVVQHPTADHHAVRAAVPDVRLDPEAGRRSGGGAGEPDRSQDRSSEATHPPRPPPTPMGYFLALSPAGPLVESAAMNASWGTSTRPTIFIRFLPSFCFSSSLRLRLMSPP